MVDVGELMLEPGAAAHAAKVCQEMKEKLHGYAKQARELSKRVNFGECLEGWALSEKFYKKAAGTPKSAYEILLRAQEIMDNMAETYLAAGRAYEKQERRNAARFTAQ